MTEAIVVTGASTGIGRAVVRKFAKNNYRVFGCVRRVADAESLRNEIGDKLTPVLFDVTDADAVRAGAAQVARELGPTARLAGLVNNAGVAACAPLLHMPMEEVRQILEINVFGPLHVTRAFAPLLGADSARAGPPGRIVNMSSAAGKLTPPFLGAYCASKHALEALSDALRRELRLYGIDVVVIEPGAVATPIWDKAESGDYAPYAATDYARPLKTFLAQAVTDGRKGVSPDAVAAAVYRGMTTRKPPTRIAVVPQRFKNWTVPRLLPDRVFDALVGKLFGLNRLA